MGTGYVYVSKDGGADWNRLDPRVFGFSHCTGLPGGICNSNGNGKHMYAGLAVNGDGTFATIGVSINRGNSLAQWASTASVQTVDQGESSFSVDMTSDGMYTAFGIKYSYSVRIYKYVPDPTDADVGTWTLETTIDPGIDQFGRSVAITTNLLLVGVPSSNVVYLYERDSASGLFTDTISKTWQGTNTNEFGYSVDISPTEEYCIVGSDIEDGPHEVHIYKRDSSSGDWSLDKQYNPVNPNFKHYGRKVQINTQFAVVSAPHNREGKVYVYKRDTSTELWPDTTTTILEATSPVERDTAFGEHMFLRGTLLVVGANRQWSHLIRVHLYDFGAGAVPATTPVAIFRENCQDYLER